LAARIDWKRWVFAVVPLVGVVELVAHVGQSRGAVSDKDWSAARDAVKAIAKPEDLVVFAPSWSDPLGRMWFGKDVATVAREARPDESRFPRAIEVSIRGKHVPELATWRATAEQKVGAITIRTLENPAPVKVLTDLVARVTPETMKVTRFDGQREQDCAFARGPAQTGNLGFGPAIPGDKFNCGGGGFVGVSVFAVLDYTARQCIYATPPSGTGSTRMRFLDVVMGRALHGHHALYVEAERHRDGAPVTLQFRVGERAIGKLVHLDGEGWKSFELDTSEWQGQTVELTAEVSAPSGHRRMYCFEADTR
jgi:hypothetical protein